MTIRRTLDGHYVIGWFEDFSVWMQWRCWNFEALNRTFCPMVLSMPLSSPPEIAEGVELVVTTIKKAQEEIDKERGPKSRYGWKAIPSAPAPFSPWTQGFATEMDDLERARRQIDGNSFLMAPVYPYGAAAAHRLLSLRVSDKLLLAAAAKTAKEITPDINDDSHIGLI